nr:hypothetical protein CFP56_28692 [Quercus suber]
MAGRAGKQLVRWVEISGRLVRDPYSTVGVRLELRGTASHDTSRQLFSESAALAFLGSYLQYSTLSTRLFPHHRQASTPASVCINLSTWCRASSRSARVSFAGLLIFHSPVRGGGRGGRFRHERCGAPGSRVIVWRGFLECPSSSRGVYPRNHHAHANENAPPTLRFVSGPVMRRCPSMRYVERIANIATSSSLHLREAAPVACLFLRVDDDERRKSDSMMHSLLLYIGEVVIYQHQQTEAVHIPDIGGEQVHHRPLLTAGKCVMTSDSSGSAPETFAMKSLAAVVGIGARMRLEVSRVIDSSGLYKDSLQSRGSLPQQ